jgi:putative phosphoribosyl transferase
MFVDRYDAGQKLAQKLGEYANRHDVAVLALPRGGVPVGYEVARHLGVPLDIFLVRKLGVPGHDELAMGAIGSGGVRVLNEQLIRELRISGNDIERVTAEEFQELERREKAYRGGKAPPLVEGKTVILVDDGLATGSTMRAAIKALRRLDPASIVVAVPVGSADTCREFQSEADKVICAREPRHFGAVSMWYANFDQTTDEEVEELLSRDLLVDH